MNIKKEAAIQEIMDNFTDFSNLILAQLDMLEKVMASDETVIPEDTLAAIKANEKKMDSYEVIISEKIVNTIVLYQPLAGDLRKLIACYRMTLNLERIGDLIINITNFIRKIKNPEIFENLSDVISNMLMSSAIMVRKALLSYLNSDRDSAVWTIRNDAVVDEMNQKLIKKAIGNSTLSKETQRTLQSFISINSILSNIERIADHATNIAEASIYSLEGRDIRHDEELEKESPDAGNDAEQGKKN